MRYISKQSGVAALFALLLVSVFLGIVLTISTIFIPKIHLARDSRYSITAVYAADSAIKYCLSMNLKEPTTPLYMENGSYYSTDPADCSFSPIRAKGTYKGITRVFEITF